MAYQLAAVVDWSDDAIARLDKNGIIIYWNKGAEKLYGYAEDEMLGKHIAILEDSRGINLDELDYAEQDIRPLAKEVIRRTKAGKYIHVLRTVSPIRNSENGEVIGYASISRSIEARIKAEQRLSASANHLRKANRDLKDFVYIASHDLQEPLRLISSYLQIIKEDYGDKFDEDGERYIDYTLQSSQRLQSLINDLLGYSRLNTTQQPLAKIDLEKLVAHTINDQQILIQEKNGTIKIDGELPRVFGDQAQLGLVFSNLITNALKYSSNERLPEITISATSNTDETIICVADNGIGFEQRQAERIFQVFRRLHAPHQYSGTGIGLSICKKVIDRHGGRIWAESEPGVGSQFFFSVPHNIDPDTFNSSEES